MSGKSNTDGSTAGIKLYVTGWLQQVTADDVKRRFEGIRGVVKVDRVIMGSKRFAHVELVASVPADMLLATLQSTYKSSKWKGGSLSFEVSKPDFHIRLDMERQAEADGPVWSKKGEWIPPRRVVYNSEPLAGDDWKNLRIRGTADSKRHGTTIVFNDDEDDVQIQSPLNQSGPWSEKILESQHPAYCCSTGDAGPSTVCEDAGPKRQKRESILGQGKEPQGMVESSPATQQNIAQHEVPQLSDKVEGTSKPGSAESKQATIDESMIGERYEDEEDAKELSVLAKFVLTHSLPLREKKKNSSKSVLGQWRAMQTNM